MMRGTLSGASALGGALSASEGLGGTLTTGGRVYPTYEGASESIQLSVDAWLAAHPEATTTVQDDSIADAKLVQTGGVLSEVHDIRIGAGGTVYASAGDAVRAIESKHDSDIGLLFGSTVFDMSEYEKGGFTANGGNDNSYRYNVRARSKGRISFYTDVTISSATVRSQVIQYDPDTDSYLPATDWSRNTELSAGVEYRILFDGAYGSSATTAMSLEEILAKFTIMSHIDVNDMRDELDTLLEDAASIPPYYFAGGYLDERALTAQKKAGCNGVSFGFITDVHTGDSACNSMKLMKYIADRTSAIPFVLFGGDVPETNTGTVDGMHGQAMKWQQMMSEYGKHRVYSCRGNHDYLAKMADDSGYSATHWESQGYVMGYMPDNIHVSGNGNLSYYFDIEDMSTRIIVIDQYSVSGRPTFTGYVGISASDYSWLVNEALDINDYKVIIVMHQPINLDGGEGYSDNLALLKSVVSGFANHDHVQGSWGQAVVDKDFTDNTSELVCVLSGHVHKDASGTNDDFLTITTTSDAIYSTDGYSRSVGNTSEGAFDVISVDYDNRKIYCTRIGAGADREFNY